LSGAFAAREFRGRCCSESETTTATSAVSSAQVKRRSRHVTRTELNWQNYSENTLSLRTSFTWSKLAIANYATRFAVFAANQCGVGRYDVARERA